MCRLHLSRSGTFLANSFHNVYAIYGELIFQAQAERSYILHYGNKDAIFPQYDLEKYFQYLDTSQAVQVPLGPHSLNEQYIEEKQPEEPLSEKMPYFLPIVLCTFGLILLVLVYKFLEK